MINFTPRLNSAINTATRAHHQVHQMRKGTDIPFIVHPYGVMLIASQVTKDEDTLIACLFHDILEDVATKDPKVYNQKMMRQEYGDKVTEIVQDVSHDDNIYNWHDSNKAYIKHIINNACQEAVIVSAADKIHNLNAMVQDYKEVGDKLADRFTTKSLGDQEWKYAELYKALKHRQAPALLLNQLDKLLNEFVMLINTNAK